MSEKEKCFADLFRAIRIEKEITLREIKEYCGLSISYLSDIEHKRKGAPSLDIVNKIQKCLGVTNNSLIVLAQQERKSALEKLNEIQSQLEVVTAERDKLRIALADAIRRPMGVVPDSAIGLIKEALKDFK